MISTGTPRHRSACGKSFGAFGEKTRLGWSSSSFSAVVYILFWRTCPASSASTSPSCRVIIICGRRIHRQTYQRLIPASSPECGTSDSCARHRGSARLLLGTEGVQDLNRILNPSSDVSAHSARPILAETLRRNYYCWRIPVSLSSWRPSCHANRPCPGIHGRRYGASTTGSCIRGEYRWSHDRTSLHLLNGKSRRVFGQMHEACRFGDSFCWVGLSVCLYLMSHSASRIGENVLSGRRHN